MKAQAIYRLVPARPCEKRDIHIQRTEPWPRTQAKHGRAGSGVCVAAQRVIGCACHLRHLCQPDNFWLADPTKPPNIAVRISFHYKATDDLSSILPPSSEARQWPRIILRTLIVRERRPTRKLPARRRRAPRLRMCRLRLNTEFTEPHRGHREEASLGAAPWRSA